MPVKEAPDGLGKITSRSGNYQLRSVALRQDSVTGEGAQQKRGSSGRDLV